MSASEIGSNLSGGNANVDRLFGQILQLHDSQTEIHRFAIELPIVREVLVGEILSSED